MGLIRDSAGGLQAVRSGLSVELVGSCELAGSCWWAHAVGELRASRRRVCSDLATQVAPARTRSGVWCHKIQHPKHPSVTDATQETGFSHLFEWCGPVCCSAVCVAEQCASQSSVRCRAVCVAEQQPASERLGGQAPALSTWPYCTSWDDCKHRDGQRRPGVDVVRAWWQAESEAGRARLRVRPMLTCRW